MSRVQRMAEWLSAAEGPRQACVFSGSGLRLAWHAGVAQALAEHGIRPSLIYGVSGGALVGGMWATDVLGECVRFIRNWRDHDVGYRGNPIGRFLTGKESLYRVKGLREWVYEMMRPEQLRCAYVAGTVDYHTGHYRPWTFFPDEPLTRRHLMQDAAIASASIPVLAPVVKVGNGWYYDGGARHVIGDIKTLREWGVLDVVYIMLAQRYDHPPDKAYGTPGWLLKTAKLVLSRMSVYTVHDDVDDVLRWMDEDDHVHLIYARNNLGSGYDGDWQLMQKRLAHGVRDGKNYIRGYDERL